MKSKLLAGGLLVCSLFIFSGCAHSSETSDTEDEIYVIPNELRDQKPKTQKDMDEEPQIEPSESEPASTSEVSKLSAPPVEGFVLTLESVKKDEATFSWQIEEDLLEGDRFRFVRSENVDPVFDDVNYWYQVHGSHREGTWTEMPEGEWHVRLCTFNTETDPEKCMLYSNDVMVEIK